MDHNYYQPYNHFGHAQHSQYLPDPVPEPAGYLPAPASVLVSEPHPSDYYAPTSPSDFIYNSANNTSNNTASIFLPPRPSRSSHPSVPRKSTSTSTPTSTLPYPPPMGYGPSRPVEQSYPTYLPTLPESSLLEPSLPKPSLPEPKLPEPSLPEPTPGFEEHRRQHQCQRQSTMNMGPGASKSVPPPLPLEGTGNRASNSSSNESVVVISQKELSSSPVLIPLPKAKAMPMPMKKWEPRVPTSGTEEERLDTVGNTQTEMEMKEMRSVGSIDVPIEEEKWVNRGGVMERVDPSLHRATKPAWWGSNMDGNMGVNMGMRTGIGTEMGTGMGTGRGAEKEMGTETTMPKMGLFRPVRWDGPSSRSSSKAKNARAGRAGRGRGWEAEGSDGKYVHTQRPSTYGNQNDRKGLARSNSNRNQTGNNETEDEQTITVSLFSFSHPHLSKRRKTSIALAGPNFRTASAATATTINIKREPGLSPSPRAAFAQIPMYSHSDLVTNSSSGYETAGDEDGDIPSSREISPLTKVPTPRRVLFPILTPDRRQLKRRNREVAVCGQRGHLVESRERSPEGRDEGFWNVASSASQNQDTQVAQEDEHQHQNRASSSGDKGEEGWTAISISGSSEEGEVSSYYDNSYNSYSCGQERDDAPLVARAGGIYQAQRRPHHLPSFSPSAQQPSSFSERYGPASGSEPSLSAEQQRVLEQYRQAIQVVQDTCLEASKRYIRAHCVNRGVRGGDNPSPTSAPRETVEGRSVRKARRRRKLETRHGSSSSSSSSSLFSPSWQRRHRRAKGKRRTQRQKHTTTTPPFSRFPTSASQFHEEITCTDSLLPNISKICTLLWSRSQSLRLHDTDSIELHTARNMYWLLSWAETVAFAVPPTSTHLFGHSLSNGTTEASVPGPGPDVSGVPVLEELGRREQWAQPSHPSFPHRDLNPGWESVGDDLNDHEHMWRETGSEEGMEFEKSESRSEAVWEQQWQEMRRVFEEGGMLCEFLGYGEGVERLMRVREFYGF